MAISHINESVILEEVISTHDPDGKENFKINVIFDLVKSILYPITIGDSIDEEDSNGDKSDEEECDDKKFNDEESNNGNKMSDDEKEFDSEEEYAKDMELPYQLKRFSFEISLMCPNNVNLHSMVIYFLRMLSTFSWESKILIMLAAFSLYFGEFSLVHRHNKGLSGKLAILKGRERQVLPMVTHFIKSILNLTEHIVELAQSSSHNSSPIIPIGCYWILTSILTYASYFTSGLKSMHSRCFISGEKQLSSLAVKIKDVISDCHPILEKKREVDSYNALCDAFFDDEKIPSTSSNLGVLKLVFNVKKGGKQKLIYDSVRKEMVELCLLKNKSLLLLISSSLDIHKFLIFLLETIQQKAQLRVLWIPILDSPILWGIKHMKEQYRWLVNNTELLSVRNVQKSVAPGFVRFVKEKFFPAFQIGGEPIIVSLDHNGRMVHSNAIHMVLMRGLDISQRMSGGVKIGDDSIIPLLQKVLTERVSTVRDLVPGIDEKISEIADKVDDIITDWFRDIEKQIQNPVDGNIFTSKKEKELWKIETWCTKLVANLGGPISEWVEENICIFLIGGHDIQWVKTFESKVMLQNQFNPQSKIGMVYVGSNIEVALMIEQDRDCNIVAYPTYSWIFWARLRSMFLSRIKFVEETDGDKECDEILRRLKKLLAYEANGGLVVNEWAMLCKGNKIVVCDLGDKMLKVMNEYYKWKDNAIAKGFDQAFKDHHEMLDSTYTSLHHHQCALEFPSNFDRVQKNVKCPQCCREMQKFVTFKCYHSNDEDLLCLLLMALKAIAYAYGG